VVPHNRWLDAETRRNGDLRMRVLLSTYDSRGGIEPLAALGVQLQRRGVGAVVCAPPDWAGRLAEVGVPMVPVGAPVRQLVHGDKPPSREDVARRIDELLAAWFDRVATVAEDCDVVVTSGLVPAVAGARSVAEKLGIPSVHVSYCPIFIPSPRHRPNPLPGRSVPADVTDPELLNELDIENYNLVFGPVINKHRVANGLAPVDNVRDYVFGRQPWLAADPVLAPWPEEGGRDVVQTGAWAMPDQRPLPAELDKWLSAGPEPVYVSFGSMRAPHDVARLAIGAIRGQGRRVLIGRGWAELAPIDDLDDCFAIGEVNQQALFRRVAAVIHHGGAGTTTTATQAGVPQIVVPQWADQPYFARRVAALGVGAGIGAGAGGGHDGPTPAAGSLSEALATVLDPRTRQRAAAVAGTIRTDGAAVAAERLSSLVSAGDGDRRAGVR
jgi:vancomycin aglycone glucosyltransferase